MVQALVAKVDVSEEPAYTQAYPGKQLARLLAFALVRVWPLADIGCGLFRLSAEGQIAEVAAPNGFC